MTSGENISSNVEDVDDVATEIRALEATLLALISFFSIVGNVSLWIVVLQSSALRTVTNMFILGLSLSDLFVAMFNMPFTVYSIMVGYWNLDDTACQVTGFTNMLTLVTSVLSLCNISINRYFMVVKPSKFRDIYTVRNSIMMISGVTITSVVLSSLPLVGWCSYAYIHIHAFCFADWKNSVSYAFFMISCCFGLPCIVMTVCNILIFRTVRQSSRKIHQACTRSLRKDVSLNETLSDNTNYASKSQSSRGRIQFFTSCGKSTSTAINGQSRQSNQTVGHGEPVSKRNHNDDKSYEIEKSPENEISHVNDESKENDESPEKDNDQESDNLQSKYSPYHQTDTRTHATPRSAWMVERDGQINSEGSSRNVRISSTSIENLIQPCNQNQIIEIGNEDSKQDVDVREDKAHEATLRDDNPRPVITSPRFRRRDEIHLARSLAFVVILFVLCWLPYCVSMVVLIFSRDDVGPRGFHMFTLMVGYANSMCNPVIYGVMNKRFREGFKSIFSKCIPCIRV